MAAVPPHEIAQGVERLHELVASMPNVQLIIPMGDTALRALTGMSAITKRRGSIYGYQDRKGRLIKVIPTLHPAVTFPGRTPRFEARCILDWLRIKKDAEFPELRLPQRQHHIRPTLGDLDLLKADIDMVHDGVLAFDIETPRKVTWETVVRQLKKGPVEQQKRVLGDARITCIGFSLDASSSLTVPLTREYWGTLDKLAKAWEVVRWAMAHEIRKVGQSGFPFDTWWLAQPEYACPVNNYIYDTRWISHCLNPIENHSLDFIASIETREPYWKSERKVEGDFESDPRDLNGFWEYCGKDTAVTREILDVLEPRLVRRGKWEFYCDWYLALYPHLLDMSLRGVQLNKEQRNRTLALLQAKLIMVQDRLTELAGGPLYAEKDLSHQRIAKFLYETLKLPKQTKTRKTKEGGKSKSVSADEVTVRKLMLSHPEKLQEAGPLILDHRRFAKLAQGMSDNTIDADDRVRCSYGFVDSWRLSSSKNPKRTGRNLQNLDRAKIVRTQYVPYAGHLLLECDLSQAESRGVYMLTGDERLVEIARSKPWEFDDHRRIAAIIFQVAEDMVTKPQRQMGKTVNHASNYNMQGATMADGLLKEGVVRTPEECQMYIDRRLAADTGIIRWHRDVRHRVMQHRSLTNNWGAEIHFTYERLDDDLYRAAYAWEPQSTVGMLTNQWGLRALGEKIQQEGWGSRIIMQVHDSVVVSCPPHEMWQVAQFLKTSLERPRLYGHGPGEPLEMTIPVEHKVGLSLAMSYEWKKFPSRDEFMVTIEELCRQGELASP